MSNSNDALEKKTNVDLFQLYCTEETKECSSADHSKAGQKLPIGMVNVPGRSICVDIDVEFMVPLPDVTHRDYRPLPDYRKLSTTLYTEERLSSDTSESKQLQRGFDLLRLAIEANPEVKGAVTHMLEKLYVAMRNEAEDKLDVIRRAAGSTPREGVPQQRTFGTASNNNK
jgi:hypothetical protein